MRIAASDSFAGSRSNSPLIRSSERFLLAPPKEATPVEVRASFEFNDINEIDDEFILAEKKIIRDNRRQKGITLRSRWK